MTTQFLRPTNELNVLENALCFVDDLAHSKIRSNALLHAIHDRLQQLEGPTGLTRN